MKPIFITLIAVSILFLITPVTAQTFKTIDNQKKISGFNTQTSQDSFLLNQGITLNENLKTNNNAVYISQVGEKNNLVSTSASLESTIVIVQNGSQNNTVLDLSSTKLTESVIQNGNSNMFLDYSTLKTDLRSTTVHQTGNNQNLIILGSNSLSEKMKVTMQGQDQSIVIRNF